MNRKTDSLVSRMAGQPWLFSKSIICESRSQCQENARRNRRDVFLRAYRGAKDDTSAEMRHGNDEDTEKNRDSLVKRIRFERRCFDITRIT
jgi:hypothetical protein